jgi:hypothetical protein
MKPIGLSSPDLILRSIARAMRLRMRFGEDVAVSRISETLDQFMIYEVAR